MAKGQIRARIQCTVEVEVGTWGGGKTDLDVLAEQVRREGRDILEKLSREHQGHVVGTPKVLFLVLQED